MRSRYALGKWLARSSRHRSSTDRNAKQVSTRGSRDIEPPLNRKPGSPRRVSIFVLPHFFLNDREIVGVSGSIGNPDTIAFGDRIGGDRDCPLAVLQSQYRYPIRRAIGPVHTGARRCARLAFSRTASLLTGDADRREIGMESNGHAEGRCCISFCSLAPIAVISARTQARFCLSLREPRGLRPFLRGKVTRRILLKSICTFLNHKKECRF